MLFALIALEIPTQLDSIVASDKWTWCWVPFNPRHLPIILCSSRSHRSRLEHEKSKKEILITFIFSSRQWNFMQIVKFFSLSIFLNGTRCESCSVCFLSANSSRLDASAQIKNRKTNSNSSPPSPTASSSNRNVFENNFTFVFLFISFRIHSSDKVFLCANCNGCRDQKEPRGWYYVSCSACCERESPEIENPFYEALAKSWNHDYVT